MSQLFTSMDNFEQVNQITYKDLEKKVIVVITVSYLI